ncbi:FUSC family protein [Micromonospora peucetia]|uniref:FUSC family protein n=1 Tax=Micromonospora peucetia TaxID=47871 RepID=UPI00332C8A22
MSRLTNWFRTAWSRLRGGWQLLAAVTLGATASWFVADRLLGGPHGGDDSAAFYAPAAALIVLAQARGVRLRQAIRVLAGIAVGVLLGEVAIWLLGARSTAAVFVVILVAAGLSIAAGAPGVVRNQLTTSALFLVAVVPPDKELEPTRLYDALIGGTIALLITQVAGARSPLGPLDAEGRQAFAELSGVLDGIRQAVQGHDEKAARAAVDQVDYAVRNTRALARSAVVLVRLPDPPPQQLVAALTSLNQLTSCAAAVLAAVVSGDSDQADRHIGQAGKTAVDTAQAMAPLLRHEQSLPVSTIVGHIRMVVVDLLRSARADQPEVLNAIDRALDLPAVWKDR